MRISDLSRISGVPVGTIKYYLRDGLLPPGRPTGRNQADYGDAHLRRLRLIRAFTNIGQFDLSSVRRLLTAIGDHQLSLPGLYEVFDRVLTGQGAMSSERDEVGRARTETDGFIDDLGWQVKPDAPGRERLAQVLAALQRLGCGFGVDFFVPYAEAADRLAAQELDLLPSDGGPTDRAAAVLRTVLFDVALAALRRMAQEHHLSQRFSSVPPATTS